MSEWKIVNEVILGTAYPSCTAERVYKGGKGKLPSPPLPPLLLHIPLKENLLKQLIYNEQGWCLDGSGGRGASWLRVEGEREVDGCLSRGHDLTGEVRAALVLSRAGQGRGHNPHK